jgi:hypothetical protein
MDLELTYIKNPDGSKTLTIPDERRAAAIAFFRQGGTKRASEIETIVNDGHDALLGALDGISEPQAAFKPEPDEWSVLELMAHVVTAKQIVGVLAGALAQGQLPPGFGSPLEASSAQDGVTVVHFDTLAAARDASVAAHAVLLDFVRAADGPVNADMTFRHFIFGALNCREWAVFQRIHDDDHRPQIAAIRAAPGYPAR